VIFCSDPTLEELMVRFYKMAVLAALSAVLGLSFVIHAQQSRVANASSAANITNEVLRRAGTATDAHPGAWLAYGRTQGETRYSPLKQIDSTNVKRLGLAWSYVLGAGGSNQEGTPLMWNNTLYGITTWSVVFRSGCAHRKGTVAVGSRDQPDHGAAGDLLRHGESGNRSL
jgi:glucose dehydrogenase